MKCHPRTSNANLHSSPISERSRVAPLMQEPRISALCWKSAETAQTQPCISIRALGSLGLGNAAAVNPGVDAPRPSSPFGSCFTGKPIGVRGGAGSLGRHVVPQSSTCRGCREGFLFSVPWQHGFLCNLNTLMYIIFMKHT